MTNGTAKSAPSVSICLLLLPLLLFLGGCGDGPGRTPGRGPSPEGTITCRDLVHRVYEDPRTGGSFHCLWCNRRWSATVSSAGGTLFVVVAVSCERLDPRARIEVLDPGGSSLWEHEVEQGEDEVYCLREEEARSGTYSIRLSGGGESSSGFPLVKEFQGTVLVKFFDEAGEPILPDLSGPTSPTGRE